MGDDWRTTAICHQGDGPQRIKSYGVAYQDERRRDAVAIAGELVCGHRYSIATSLENLRAISERRKRRAT